tara:strand:+ start:54 stop:518 length:465 start_codon:yes stop_codon:yes gene_type:complete
MKYYNSIDDIILFNWWEIQKGNYEYCRIDIEVGTPKKDEEAHIRINDSYIAEFGISPEMEEIMELRRRIAILECDLVIDDDTFLRNEIRRLTKELNDVLSKEGKTDRDGFIVHLEKWYGMPIKEREITAKKFYKIVKEFEKEQAQIKKASSATK